MEHFFYNIYKRIQANKAITFCSALIVLLFFLFLSSQLKFEEDITKLIPENEKAVTLNKVLSQVDFADKIVVRIAVEDSIDVNLLTTVAADFIQETTNKCDDYVEEIQGVVSDNDLEETMNFVYENLPQFLTEEDYNVIENRLNQETIQKNIADNYKALISPSGFVTRKTILQDPLGLTFLGLEKLKELQVGEGFTIQNGFIITEDNKNLLLFIKPKLASNETDKNTRFVNKLYEIQTELNEKYGKKLVNYYGATVIAVANANQIKTDIQLTVSIALGVLFIILILFYKRLIIPIILFIPTLFGALLAVAALYIIRGTISAISIGIGSVLLGITLDFSLHILTHYRNNPNILKLYNDVTKPIVMSSITTTMAFLCLVFVNSRALQDLGIFAAISVLGASFFALIFIPHLYSNKTPVQSVKNNILDSIAAYSFSKNKVIISICLLISLVATLTYSKVIFDKDISKMNYQTETLLKEEKVLSNLLNTDSKSLYIVTYANSLNEVLHENEKVYNSFKSLKDNDDIASYSSLAGIITSDEIQKQRLSNWRAFWTKEKKANLQETFIKEGEKYGFKSTTFNTFYKKIAHNHAVIPFTNYTAIKALNTNEFIANKDSFYTVLSSLKVPTDKLKKVKEHFSAHKQVVVIDRQAMNEAFLNTFKDDFNNLLGYSFIAVVIVLLIFFRRIELVLITVTPIALTWLITMGLMGIFGLSFNIFNIIISTFIFGLGVDYAIFMTNGLIKEYETGKKYLPVYRTSILLSVITTILGVGVLIFAKHPALHSIASVCLIGIGTALIITFVIQPIVFKALITNRAKKGYAPLELRKTIHSFISFAFYGIGGMLLSLVAITLLKILPISKKIKFKWLHSAMAKLATSVLYSNPFVSKEVILNKETFKKQAVIIANHTSFLDTLAIALVTPKVVFLVNDWVYKSPIFGQLAKVAGYYPVSSGVDGSLDHLKKKMNQGYSLVVFPEGKRMYTNKIGRFHKGAFFLAEKLDLEILPLYIHGNSEVLPKGDFIIYDGSITVKVGDRLSMDAPELGNSIKEKTKAISSIFKNEFQRIRKEIETPIYFKKRILSNFIFKSDEIYNTVKKDIDANIKLYAKVSNSIPIDAVILHIANDYGQLDLLLNYYSNSRKISTFIAEIEKRTIAANNFIGKEREIDYLEKLAITKKTDTIIFSTAIEELQFEYILACNIIILNNCIAIQTFIKNDYEVVCQEENIILLKRSKK